MEDTLITFKTAKLAKEKGFPQSRKSKGKFRDDGSIENLGIGGAMIDTCKEWYERPAQSLLAKWLRGEHNIHIEISNNNYGKVLNWSFDLHRLPVGIIQMWKRGDITYNTYEEAYEVGLQEALKLI